MLKKLVGALLVLVVGAGFLLADEATGKFKKVENNNAKGQGVLLNVDGKNVMYRLNKDTKVYDGDELVKGAWGKFVARIKPGTEVTVIYDKVGDKITVTEVKVKK
jgi:hypothetical protein